MKSFEKIVTVMAMLTMLAGKAYPQIRHCTILDIDDCFLALHDPSTPPTEKCCDEFRQYRDCFCFYKRHYFKKYNATHACHIDFDDSCTFLSK